MNENHMKTSVTTGEVSLRWAKKADQRAKSSGNGPMSPISYFWKPQNGLQRQVMGGKSPQRPRKLNMTPWTTTQMGNPG